MSTDYLPVPRYGRPAPTERFECPHNHNVRYRIVVQKVDGERFWGQREFYMDQVCFAKLIDKAEELAPGK